MIAGVDTSHIDPTVDDGADRDRPRPCARRTWCIRTEHPESERCIEMPREARRDVTDPLPSLRSPSFTQQLRKANRP